jgi:hypothetical protein
MNTDGQDEQDFGIQCKLQSFLSNQSLALEFGNAEVDQQSDFDSCSLITSKAQPMIACVISSKQQRRILCILFIHVEIFCPASNG